MTCAARPQASETLVENTNLVIGLLVPPEEPCSAGLRNGVTLGVELANQFGGPHISLVVRGRIGQWGAHGVETARMVTDDGAQGLIAPPVGAASHLVLQVSGRTAVPVVSLCADSSVSQTGVPWMVRIVPRTVDEAKALFSAIPSEHWVAMIPDGRAGRESARDLQEAAAISGAALEKVVEFNPSFTNAARLSKQILTNHPSAILLWLDATTAGKLAKSLRAAGFTGTLAGPGRLQSAEFLKEAGKASEGLILPVPVPADESAAAFQLFTTAFKSRFGHEPDATAAMSYDAAMLLIQILRRSGGSPAHKSFPIASTFAGASGILSFDSQGNRKVNLQLLKAHGGRFAFAASESGSKE